MKLKFLPNALSTFRLLLCIPLFIMTPFTTIYMVIFFIAGSTDAIDGPIARRVKDGASEFGATLDSVADALLVCVTVFRIMPRMEIWGWLWIAYVCVLSMKIFASTGIGFIRFKEVISLHTISFKTLVFFLFCYPFLYFFIGPGLFINVYSTVMFSCGTLVVIEEILIISMTKRPERNIRSIFAVKAANLAAQASAPSGE